MLSYSQRKSEAMRKNVLFGKYPADLTPMAMGYMRVHTIGPKGLISNWSAVTEFKVI